MSTHTPRAEIPVADFQRSVRRRLRVLTVVAVTLPCLLLAAPAVASKLIGTSDIKNGAITTPKLATKAVNAVKIAPGAVGPAALQSGGVGTLALADGGVGAADLGPGAVGPDALADGSVGAAKLQPGSVDTGQLADGAVNSDKIADGDVQPADLAAATKIISSGWAYATNFVDTTIDNTAMHTATIDAPALTTAAINGSTVNVWFTYGGNVAPLPYTSYAGGKLNTISFQLENGKILITRSAADNSTTVALSTLLQYRYTITPSGATAAAGAPAAARPSVHATRSD